jgi:FAD:protein FMN transferase
MLSRYQQKRVELGSDAVITLICESQAEAENIFHELWALIEEFEKRFSRFLKTSELSHINMSAGMKTICSTEMTNILKESIFWGNKTKGVFNPFILPLLVEAGYDSSWVDHQSAPHLPRALRMPVISELEIGDDWVMIPEDGALDLGGIGKGYLLDQLASHLKGKVENYWLSFGGDVLASGTDIDNVPWKIGIASAEDDSQAIASVELPVTEEWAVATSGINRRKGTHKGKDWHHLIQPATGQPAETDIATATLVSRSAIECDVLASCTVILGSKLYKELLGESEINDYLFQTTSQGINVSGNMIKLEGGIK